MQEILDQLKAQAGLTEEQALKSLETISNYIKSKLPSMMHPMIDNFLSASSNTNEEEDFLG